ncbi:hypothetical protein K438DRAFT_1774854 [Mycena galopus ATCC 62051]|nr:hypothetical protein K438DRAFT_1774854 [Mycena galopus ATCC 62051]
MRTGAARTRVRVQMRHAKKSRGGDEDLWGENEAGERPGGGTRARVGSESGDDGENATRRKENIVEDLAVLQNERLVHHLHVEARVERFEDEEVGDLGRWSGPRADRGEGQGKATQSGPVIQWDGRRMGARTRWIGREGRRTK